MNKYILCTDGSAKLVGDSIYDSASAFCLFDEKMNIIKKDSEYLKGKTMKHTALLNSPISPNGTPLLKAQKD